MAVGFTSPGLALGMLSTLLKDRGIITVDHLANAVLAKHFEAGDGIVRQYWDLVNALIGCDEPSTTEEAT